MEKVKKSDGSTIVIQQVKSAIGYHKSQKDTVRALGIRRMGQKVEQKDTPQIRGMVQKVSHLVKIIEEN